MMPLSGDLRCLLVAAVLGFERPEPIRDVERRRRGCIVIEYDRYAGRVGSDGLTSMRSKARPVRRCRRLGRP